MELTRFARCSVFKEHGILPPESYDTTICASNQAVSFATGSDFLRRCEGRNAACFSVGRPCGQAPSRQSPFRRRLL